jgi:hypothetical protein
VPLGAFAFEQSLETLYSVARPLERIARTLQGLMAATQDVTGAGAPQVEEALFAFVGTMLAVIQGSLALVGELLALIGEPLAFVGHAVALIRERLPLVGETIPFARKLLSPLEVEPQPRVALHAGR